MSTMIPSSDDLKQLPDTELINLTLDTDKEYFGELVYRYEAKIFRYLNRLLNYNKNSAEECLSETFLKAYINLSSYSTRASFSTWIYRIAHNQAVDHLRRESKWSLVELEDEHATFNPVTYYEDKDYIEHILSKLNIKDRNLLTLFYLEELSLNEISDILKIKSNTLAVKIKRAKEKLRKLNPPQS